jgi:hypothetical protein
MNVRIAILWTDMVAEVTFGPNMDEVTRQYRKPHNECHNLQALYYMF